MTTMQMKASATRRITTPPLDQRTPGDWTCGDRSNGRGFWIGPNEEEAVAKTVDRNPNGRRGEARANARMLASGPDLIAHIRNIAQLSGDARLDAIEAAVAAADRIEGLA